MHIPVSVIIPCYCCSETIERAVNSVMAQTMLPAELWLVDDASPDEGRTLNKLHELKEQYSHLLHIEVIALPKNGGPSVARNAGWEKATQPYIAFLDADDSWHPRKLEIQYGWMKEHPETYLTGHRCLWLKVDAYPHIPMQENGQFYVKRVTPFSLLLSNRFSTRSVILKRDLPFRFDPLKRYSEDYLLWLQIALSGYKCCLLELPLAYLFKAPYGESGLSGDLWSMERGQLDTFYRLYKEGYISGLVWAFLILFSVAKFCRRIVLVGARRIAEEIKK